jgi:hypothetical protein
MARKGAAPSQMLRALVDKLGPIVADRQALVRAFSEAFCFTEGQGYCIFGWLPDGSGYLSDSQLDYLLTKRIVQTRGEWDRGESLDGRNSSGVGSEGLLSTRRT